MNTFERPLEFRTALVALRALLRDPDDTKQAFRIAQALSGRSAERNFRRFRATRVGRAVLRERRVLLDRLRDQQALAALPEGSLGRAYLEFLESQRITAQGLVDASQQTDAGAKLDPERELFSDRLRDMHDLWHALTGYRGDLIGEAALLAFTFAQTKNAGVGAIAVMALAHAGPLPGARRVILDGFVRGVRARWLAAADWESLLARPLQDVRAELEVGPAPDYTAVYSHDPRVRQALANAT